MSNIVKHGGVAVAALPSTLNLTDLRTLGEVFKQSGFFSDTRDAAQAIVKIMAGQELGFGPIASMTGVYIVKGRVSLSANLMAAAVKRGSKYNYRVREHSDEACTLEFFENGQSLGTSRFTMAEAVAGNLHMDWNKDKQKWVEKATWKNFPRNMLFARAMSNGVKWHCPDIFGGPVYTPDELGATIDGETGEVIEIPVERPALRQIEPESKSNTGNLRRVAEIIEDILPEPDESEPSTQHPTAAPLTGQAKQIDALRVTLGWSEAALAEVIGEEFKIQVTGEYADLLESLDGAQRRTVIDLLKAELKQRAATR